MEVALSGLLVAVLVAIWAVVLVPMLVHRHGGVATETDAPAPRRVLPRRRPAPDDARRYAVRPRTRRRRPRRPGEVAMLRRRRLTLLVLAFVAITGVIGVALGSLPWPVPALGAVLFLGYVGGLRAHAVRAAARRRQDRRAEIARRIARFRDFAPAAPVTAPPGAAAQVAAPTPAAPTVVEPRLEPAAQDVPAAVDGTAWTPVPVPLPTYVTAPPAPRVAAGDWHEEDLAAEGELPGRAADYGLEAEDGTGVDRRRAVGD